MKSVKRNYFPAQNSFFPTLFNDFFADDFATKANLHRHRVPTKTTTVPAINISNGEKAFGIDIVAAGFEKSDFDIKFEENKLTISAAIKKDQKKKEVTYTHQGFVRQAFSKTFLVDEKEIDVEAITASYEAGVLTVTVPKKEKEVVKHQIKIQ